MSEKNVSDMKMFILDIRLDGSYLLPVPDCVHRHIKMRIEAYIVDIDPQCDLSTSYVYILAYHLFLISGKDKLEESTDFD